MGGLCGKKSKDKDKTFDAALQFDQDFKIKFKYPLV